MKVLISCGILLLLVGCSVNTLFVGSMRDTYKAIAPEYKSYVEKDPAMSAEDKQLRLDTIKQWDTTLTEGEK